MAIVCGTDFTKHSVEVSCAAGALARRLNHIQISAIYSSPLDRAIETAQAVAICQKLDVHIRQDLGEARIGEWTGKLIKELNITIQ